MQRLRLELSSVFVRTRLDIQRNLRGLQRRLESLVYQGLNEALSQKMRDYYQ